jgi:uncharacterized protein (TIGR03437 family)
MDAAQTNFKKISFLFTTAALLLTAPFQASAQTAVNVSSTSVTVGSSACNQFQNVSVSSADGTNQGFTVAVTYDPKNQFGNWLYAGLTLGGGVTSTGTTFTAQTGTTGVSLTIGLNYGLANNSGTASVVITPTDGAPAQTITVYYTQNSSCGPNTGNPSNNYITLSPGNLTLTAASNGSQSITVTVQDISGGPYVFTPSVSPSNSWLSVTASSVTLTAGGTTTLTVTADATKTQGPGNYVGSLTVTPGTGSPGNTYPGTTINVPVNFTVTNGTSSGGGGGSNGTLTINGASATSYTTSFSYVAPTAPGGIVVNIQDTAPGANAYSWQVSTSSGGNWLLANNTASGSTSQLLAPQSFATVNLSLSNAISGLPSGNYQGSVLLTSSSGSQATINVNLYVSAGVAPGINVTPSAIFSFGNVATNSNVIQQQVFAVTASPGYVITNVSLGSSANGFSISSPVASNNTETFTVTSNSTGLIAGVYSTTVTITSSINNSTNTTTITIVLPVGQSGATTGGGGGTGTTTVAPASLSFQQQQGSSFWTGNQEAQQVVITGAQGTQWTASITYAAGANNWLNLDSGSSGTFNGGPATLLVDLFNVSSLAASTTPYQATVNIQTTNGTFPVAVSLLVTAPNAPVLLGLPASAIFNANTGTSVPNQNVQIVGSDNTSSATNPPLSVGSPTASWVTATASGNTMTISVNASGQSSGVYSATIPVSATAYSNPINYPVILVVNGGGGGGTGNSGPLTFSPPTLPFTNVTAQISQNLGVTASSSTPFTVSPSETNCTSQNWLSITNGSSFTATSVTTNVQVSVNPSGIANGTTCSGTVSLVTSSATQTVGVTMTVGTSSGGGNVTVSPTSLTFNYTQNQTVPAVQNVSVVNAVSNTAPIPFNVTTTETTGTSVQWLVVNANSGTTPNNSPGLGVSVAPGNLNPGQYTGTVNIAPNGGSVQTVSVTLNITSVANVTATPTTISMTYLVGQTAPSSTIQVSAGGAAAPFTATASSTGGWLAVSPTSGTTPNTGTFNLNVTTVASALASLLPSGTPYTGTITVAGTSPATGTTIINVSLTVSAPLPVITGITNNASGATGAISPGEIISIYGTPANPIGPALPAQLDGTTCPSPCTQVPIQMGGVQVKFLPGGQMAPMLFVSQGQINAVVPYGVAGQAGLSVEVLYLGQSSNAFPISQTPTAPGLYTANVSGAGQAAVIQYDDKGNYQGYNLPATPAKAGWTLVLYLTGEGNVSPQPASGAVTVYNANANPPVPVPLVAPHVLIGNQPATVSFYGEAPGLVSGVLQINVLVPPGAGTGPQLVSVSLGTASSQAGVTVSLQ